MSGPLLSQPQVLLPNRRLPEQRVGDLHLWQTGEPLSAATLNANFLLLLNLVGAAATQRNTDPALARAVADNARSRDRLDVLEARVQAQAQLPVPWQAIGEIQRRLFDLGTLAQSLQQRLEGDEGISSRTAAIVAGLLDALECEPTPATAEQFAVLQKDLKQAQMEARSAFGQVAGLQAELAALRALVTDPDRGTQNKRLYAPLAAVGQLLARITAIEARLKERS